MIFGGKTENLCKGCVLILNLNEKKIKKFEDENIELLQNDIVTSFLKQPLNKQSYLKAISEPTKENMEDLDNKFKQFYFKIRFVSHISSTLHFNSVNFDKRQRKLQSRFQTTFSKNSGNEGEDNNYFDSIPDKNADISLNTLLSKEDITKQISCPKLYVALNRLSPKQMQIINLAYVIGLNDTEISILLGKSQQAISKMHKKALGNLIDYIESNNAEGGTISDIKYI